MALDFDRDRHLYRLDGELVPSVTQILAPIVAEYLQRIPPWLLDSVRERGTIVHQAIEAFNQNDLDVDRFAHDYPEYFPYFSGWLDFCAVRKVRTIVDEHRIASRRHRVAGTLDCLALLDGAAVLLDFKTGPPKALAAHLQTAGYYLLAREWSSEDAVLASFFARYGVVQRYGVQLTKTGGFRVHAYTDPGDFREFLALVDAHHIVRKYTAHRWADDDAEVA